MQEVIVKDFMGNELKVGDYVVITEKTNSNTPYMVYGVINKISDPAFFKNGAFDHITIKIAVINRSDTQRSVLEDNGYTNWSNLSTAGFRYSDKCYINILKVK